MTIKDLIKQTGTAITKGIGDAFTGLKEKRQEIQKEEYKPISLSEMLGGSSYHKETTIGERLRTPLLGIAKPKDTREIREFRVALGKEPIEMDISKTTAVVGGLFQRIPEIVPRAIAIGYSDAVSATFATYDHIKGYEDFADAWIKRGEEVKLPIDARRLGFEEKTIRGSAAEMMHMIDQGYTPIQAALLVGGSRTLDIAVAGSIITGTARATLRTFKNTPISAKKVEAIQFFGAPKNQTELERAIRASRKVWHPDKITGNTEMWNLVQKYREALITDGKLMFPAQQDFIRYNAWRATEALSKETVIANITKMRPVAGTGKQQLTIRNWKEIWEETKTFPGRFIKPDIFAGKTPGITKPVIGELPGYTTKPQPSVGLSIQKWEAIGGQEAQVAKRLVDKVGKEQANQIIASKGAQILKDIASVGISRAIDTAIEAPGQSLIQEAKKYKSAEEFVKAQENNEQLIKIYRGQKGDNLTLEGPRDGVGRPFTTEKDIANVYGHKGKTFEGFIKKDDVLIYDNLDPETQKYAKGIVDERIDNVMKEWNDDYFQPYEDLVFELSEIAMTKNKKAIDITSFNIPTEREIRVLDLDAFTPKSQLTDLWNKAQKVEVPKKPKALTGAEQLKLREAEKLAREDAKLRKELLEFYEGDLESQYQSFKKLVSPSRLYEIEDVAQFKNKIKASSNEIDNLLYSQERTADEVFEMFKSRRLEEQAPLPQVGKETKAMVAEKARRSIMSEKEKVNRRREFIKAVKSQFGLSDNDLRRISQKDIRLMNDFEFKTFLDDARWKAAELAETKQAKNELMTTIREGELQKVDNLRKAMQLPPISKMTESQLRQFDEALSPFQRGDIFLSQRSLELIDRTKLRGSRTLREAREALAKEMGVPVEKLEQIKYDWSDLIRYDTALAEKNPFYKIMVERSQESVLKSDARFLNIERESDKLAKLAEKSRKNLNIKEKVWNLFAPQDSDIVRYLEANIKDKINIGKNLTKEQLDYAHYIERYFNSAYDHLVEMKSLTGSRFEDIYYPHMRKNFFENVKDNGVLKAFKSLKKTEEQDRVVFSIIGEDTGIILSKEKFFSNILYRTGELDPSLNVTKTFKRYVKAFEKKKALDEIIPEIEIYAQSLTPTSLTPKGLEMDRRLKGFVKKYLNNKKGRKATYGGFVEQNGTIDMGLRAGNTFVAIKDLGFNIYAGIAATVGEQVMTYQTLGKLKYIKAWKRRVWDTGISRLSHKNANKILTENKEFIGKDIWTELAEAGEGLSEKFTKVLFGMFSQSSVEANKLFLLGSITRAELSAGKLSAERLAKLKIEAGRWRDLGRDMKSVLGSTSVGATATKYKGWAVPIMRTNTNNLIKIGSKLKGGNFKEALSGKEVLELYRAIELSAILLMIGGYIISEEKDESFIGKLKARAYMEAKTFLGGIDPTLFLATPRLYNFIQDFASNLKKIILLEKYEQSGMWGEEGDLKGVSGMQRLLAPNVLQGFFRGSSGGEKSLQDVLEELREPSGGEKSLQEVLEELRK